MTSVVDWYKQTFAFCYDNPDLGPKGECENPNHNNNTGNTSPNNWGDPNSLQKHFEKHGADFKASTPEDYARQASEFRNKPGNEIDVDPQGVTRMFDRATNTFGSYNPDGSTKTFFKPTSDSYWDRKDWPRC